MKDAERPDKNTIEARRAAGKSKRKYKKAIGRGREELVAVAILKARRDAGIPYGQ
jgi:hypothetical protein